MNVLRFVQSISILATLTLILIASFFLGPAEAADASLTDIVITNVEDHLLVYVTVTDCFTEEMKKAIDNGINTTFTVFVKLYEVKRLWFDKKIAHLQVNHEIQYDSLKKVYRVRLSENENKVISVDDFNEARKLMTEIVGLRVAELGSLREGYRYEVRMMAELDKIRLPLHLHYVFFFLSLWDFETDWYTVDFKY